MSSKKVFYALVAMIVIVIGTIMATIYFGNQLLAKESDKLVNLKAEGVIIQKKEAALLKAKSDIQKYSDVEEITQIIVPTDKDQAKAVREIYAFGQQLGINIDMVRFPESNLGAPVASGRNSQNSSGSNTQQEKLPSISQAVPVKGIQGVYSLLMTVEPQKNTEVLSYGQLIEFLRLLENNRRTAQVQKISINNLGGGNADQLYFTIQLNIFLKP